jgi:lipopolysaccharide/colanic/teichoic acid biosynthesis glycosyltransferase
MAVIGPRPIVEREKVYLRRQIRAHLQGQAGISGLWQVSGRSDTTYEQRVRLDCYYIMNWSPWLDYFILLKTVRKCSSVGEPNKRARESSLF